MGQNPLERYQEHLSSSSLEEDKEQLKAVTQLQRLYKDIVQEKRGLFSKKNKVKGVYIWGGVGRGKSMLMDMFYDCLDSKVNKRRVHFHEFMIETHEFLHAARKQDDGEAAIIKCAKNIAQNTRVLCFDEFHVTDIADAMILGRLFTALFERGLIVVATSNWPPDSLYQDGLQRDLFLPFIALLKQKLEIVEVGGELDYRVQCLSESGVYFAPLGKAQRKLFNEVFSRLTDDGPYSQEIIEVKGRDIFVEKAAKGVAFFSFSQLCENPLGAEDYLAVAKRYHTVFLEGVPKLKHRNEAKRLMTLIDVLYEHRTKLIVSADATPESLYLGHDYTFEFQRTVSRLNEMQGKDYLGL